MHDVGISTGSHQAGAERILKHVAAAPGVLADDDLCLLADTSSVIPAQKTADLNRVLKCKYFIGFAAEAVCSEIFAHLYLLTIRKHA